MKMIQDASVASYFITLAFAIFVGAALFSW
jgi:hypothetical protein